MHFLAALSRNYTFQLGTQSEGKCLTFIIRLRIITILPILSLITTLPVLTSVIVLQGNWLSEWRKGIGISWYGSSIISLCLIRVTCLYLLSQTWQRSLEDTTKSMWWYYQYARQHLLIKQWASFAVRFLEANEFSFDLFVFNYTIDPSIQMSVLPYGCYRLQTVPETYVATLGPSSVHINTTVYVSVTVWALLLRARFLLEREVQR